MAPSALWFPASQPPAGPTPSAASAAAMRTNSMPGDPGSDRPGAGAAADRGEMSGMDGVPVAAGDGGPDPVRHPVRGRWSPAAADERAFVTGRWQFDDDKLNTPASSGHRQFCRQRPSCAGKLPRRISVTCRGRLVFPLPGLRPLLTRWAAAIGAGGQPNTFLYRVVKWLLLAKPHR